MSFKEVLKLAKKQYKKEDKVLSSTKKEDQPLEAKMEKSRVYIGDHGLVVELPFSNQSEISYLKEQIIKADEKYRKEHPENISKLCPECGFKHLLKDCPNRKETGKESDFEYNPQPTKKKSWFRRKWKWLLLIFLILIAGGVAFMLLK